MSLSYDCSEVSSVFTEVTGLLIIQIQPFFGSHRTMGHWMATGKAWGLASSLWEALLAWGAGGGPVEATAPTASTATY